MAVDLAVDTALLRQAANVLDDASALLAGRASPEIAVFPLGDASLGRSAVAREVVDAAGRRVAQAYESAVLLAAMATDVAEKTRCAATAFDLAETANAAAPR
jgi:hypothetical protein